MLLGCSSGKDDAASGAAPPSQISIAIEAMPTQLDPRLATDAHSERLGQLLFHKLVRVGAGQKVVGDLAESWETPTPTEYRFHLKHGVTFHDGTPLTARDVVYTFRWIMDKSNRSPHRSAYEMIDEIRAEDDHTVLFTLTEPHAPFLINMSRGIVPAHLGDTLEFAAKPIGSGPYQLAEIRYGERIELVANPHYIGGEPPTKRLIFRIMPEDTVRMLALKKGDVQLVLNALPPDAIDLLAREPHLVVERGTGSNFKYLGFNLEDAALSHVKVRQAIAHAIDRNTIISALLQGQARLASGMLTPEHWAFAQGQRYDYDPARAMTLLDEAGYPDPEGDAPRLSLTFKTSQNELARRIAEVFQAQLARIGIAVTVRAYEWGTFYADIKSGNFQLYSLQWVGITEPDIFYNVFHSASIPPIGANRGRFRNARVDALTEQARITLQPEARAVLYAEVQTILADELPYVPLWHPEVVLVRDRRLSGFELTPAGDYYSLAKTILAAH